MTSWSRRGLAVLLAAPLAAQGSQSPLHVVYGLVFDSVAQAPLVGAVVQITSRETTGPVYSSTTDSTGHFRIAELPLGQFLIGFYHDALTALGLDAPLRTFELAADTNVTIDLGVPSGLAVRTLRCGRDSTKDRDGMLAGFVRTAGDNAVRSGATVTVEWRAIALDPGNLRTVPQRESATVGADGAYRVCKLPVEAPLSLRVTVPGYFTIAGRIVVPIASVLRQDFRLAESSVARGAASLRGRVVHENGKPILSARAVIAALALDVPVRDGTFRLTDLPLGTWVVEVRAVGLEPRSALIDATDGGTDWTTITMGDRTQQLDAVTVIGAPSRNSKILDDVLRRQRSSFGTVFLPGNPWLEGAQHAADVLRAARGFSFRSPTEVYGRPMPEGPCTAINVYVNGAFFPGGLEALDNMVSVRDVLAIEAYPDVAFAPIQWRGNLGVTLGPKSAKVRSGLDLGPKSAKVCAVVVVWTTR